MVIQIVTGLIKKSTCKWLHADKTHAVQELAVIGLAVLFFQHSDMLCFFPFQDQRILIESSDFPS